MAGLPRQVSSFDSYAQRCRRTAAAGLATATFTGLRKGELRAGYSYLATVVRFTSTTWCAVKFGCCRKSGSEVARLACLSPRTGDQVPEVGRTITVAQLLLRQADLAPAANYYVTVEDEGARQAMQRLQSVCDARAMCIRGVERD